MGRHSALRVLHYTARRGALPDRKGAIYSSCVFVVFVVCSIPSFGPCRSSSAGRPGDGWGHSEPVYFLYLAPSAWGAFPVNKILVIRTTVHPPAHPTLLPASNGTEISPPPLATTPTHPHPTRWQRHPFAPIHSLLFPTHRFPVCIPSASPSASPLHLLHISHTHTHHPHTHTH
jgi:hypothetical protein